MKMRKKSDLPSKICRTCARPFVWRKKWFFALSGELYVKSSIILDEEKNNFSEDRIIKKLNQNLVSFESKIFLEIVKLWIQKSLDEGTLINKYLSFLNKYDYKHLCLQGLP